MNITTVTVEESDKLFSWIQAHGQIKKIRHILANKHNAHDQIKAIKKLLELTNPTEET